MNRRARRLPTSVPVPVDPQFVQKFCDHGWPRVERIWGKPRVIVWARVIGVKNLIQMRREYKKRVAEERALARLRRQYLKGRRG